LFFQPSTGKWFDRIDHNTMESDDDAVASVAAAHGTRQSDVECYVGVRNDEGEGDLDLSVEQREALAKSPEWVGAPPGIPVPGDGAANLISRADAPLPRILILGAKIKAGTATLTELNEYIAGRDRL
jgi:hypothetical protein